MNEHKDSTIIIDPSPISTLDFKLSYEEKEFLLSEGRAAARKFLKAQSLISEEEYNQAKAAAEEAKKRAVAIRQVRPSRRKNLLRGAAVVAIALVVAPEEKVTRWGSISAADDDFQRAIQLLFRPALQGVPSYLQAGPVNPKGGVSFWGEAGKDSTGQIDQSSRLYIEVWDRKAVSGQLDPSGARFNPLSLCISPEIGGFIGVQLTDDEILFEAKDVSVKLAGNLEADPITGHVYFRNAFTNNDWYLLGEFKAHRDGFFTVPRKSCLEMLQRYPRVYNQR